MKIQGNTNTQAKTGGLFCFIYERFINFLTSVFRHEEKDNP